MHKSTVTGIGQGRWEVNCRSAMLPMSIIYPCVAWSQCACFTCPTRSSCCPPHRRASRPLAARKMQGLGEGPPLTPTHPSEQSAAPSFAPQSTPSRFTQSSSSRSTLRKAGCGPKAEVTESSYTTGWLLCQTPLSTCWSVSALSP